jgi:Putative peptidoglycan binding domain
MTIKSTAQTPTRMPPKPAPTVGFGRPSTWLRGLATAIAVAVLSTAAILTISTPAHASSSSCSTEYQWYWYDYNGDPAIQAVEPTLAEPFNYYIWTPAAWWGDGSPRWSCYLSYGSTGEAVKSLQRALNYCYSNSDHSYVLNAVNLGFDPLAVDGQFGRKTRAALVAAQQYHGISADGGYGPQTATTMRFKASPMDGPWTLPMCHTLMP